MDRDTANKIDNERRGLLVNAKLLRNGRRI